MKLTPAQVYGLARDAGLSATAAAIATAVAIGESGLDTLAVGDSGLQTDTWGPSVGLWQIRSLKADYGTGRTRDATRLTDPRFNAASMAAISGAGGNFRPWTVYSSGRYRDHLADARAAATQPADPIPDKRSGFVVPGPDGVDTPLERAGEAAGGVLDALNPLNVFAGWQDDLVGVGIKLGATVAGLWLVVAGVKAAVGKDGQP